MTVLWKTVGAALRRGLASGMASGARACGPILLHAGPVSVRVLGERVTNDLSARVLDAIDDPVALVDGEPVRVDELLRTVIGRALGDRCGPVTVLHPSWWPATRVARVVDALPANAPAAAVMSRSEAVRRHRGGSTVVVEIAAEHVAVSGPAALRMLDRRDVRAIAEVTGRCAGRATVLIDAPGEVPGAGHTAEAIRNALERRDIRAHMADVGADVGAGAPAIGHGTAKRSRLLAVRAPVAVVAIAAVAVCGAAAWPRAGAPHPGDPVTSLIQGRMAVDIPRDWPVRRVSAGPGSRRVEIASPHDAAAVLHITFAYAPGTTLAQAAEILGRAAAAAPAGVFVDFRAAADVAGRRAVTYREIRPGRVVAWSVVLDRSTRIGIGCQSAPGREHTVREVCEAAVASARELT